MRTAFVIALATFTIVLSPALANAQTQVPNAPVQADDRYRFNPVEGGVLRLDSRTGQVSFCKQSVGSWACETVADDRAALEKEIARLQERIAALEKQSPATRLQLPTDAEIDQAMSFFERIMRRFKSMMEMLQRESAETPGKT